MADDDKKERINPGYAINQLIKSLSSSGETAQKKTAQWKKVITGLIDGSLNIGSRTPVENTPAWVTLDVAHGGFATGDFAASGPLLPHENEKLKELQKTSELESDEGEQSEESVRGLLNLYYTSEAGRGELAAMSQKGMYRVAVPEESALLVVAWLLDKKEHELAATLLEELSPFFEKLRFYPQPSTHQIRLGKNVSVQNACEVVSSLMSKEAKPAILAMNEAITVWTPLYDQCVSLFIETVEGDLPHFEKNEKGELKRQENGQPVVAGGWPMKQCPDGWDSKAEALLKEYEKTKSKNSWRCRKHKKPKENFARLRGYLKIASQSKETLTGRDVGMIRKIIASFVTKHGAPDSDQRRKTREMQAVLSNATLHCDLARTVADRLHQFPDDEGIADLEQFLEPLSKEEAKKDKTKPGDEIPLYIQKRAMRCMEAPLETLVEKNIVPSSEVMAELLPSLTACITAESIDDPELARIFTATYKAFRQRRSLLLLHLASQAKFGELPWMKAIGDWTVSEDSSKSAAFEAMQEVMRLALVTFPQTIIPNKLVKELRTMSKIAGIEVSLVDELAADIFMGAFSPNFVRAAKQSAEIMQGTIYERYYGIDYGAILKMEDADATKYGTAISNEFAGTCYNLAGVNRHESGYSVSRNGCIIEQSQIVTTHNLANIISALDLDKEMLSLFPEMARQSFKWICNRLKMKVSFWKAELQSIKNCAYAWRQMILYLSMIDRDEVDNFIKWADEYMSEESDEFQSRFAPAMNGLKAVLKGEHFEADGTHKEGGRQFLGWTTSRHWLRTKND